MAGLSFHFDATMFPGAYCALGIDTAVMKTDPYLSSQPVRRSGGGRRDDKAGKTVSAQHRQASERTAVEKAVGQEQRGSGRAGRQGTSKIFTS